MRLPGIWALGIANKRQIGMSMTGLHTVRRRCFVMVLAASLAVSTATVAFAAPSESPTPTAWSVTPSPVADSGDFLNAVACPSAKHCVAVGNTSRFALTLAWNGNEWSDTANPYVSTKASLAGVSCVSDTHCVAVGSAFDGQHAQPLIETWNGKTWSAARGPRSSSQDSFNAVSCVSTTRCVAVGRSYPDGGTLTGSLAEVWNGKRWSVMPRGTLPFGWTVNLTGVSCASASRCVAVGSAIPANSIASQSLIESWNGRRWSVAQSIDGGASVVSSSLAAVSCASATSCFAVGSTFNQGNGSDTLVKGWEGARWSIRPSPNAPDKNLPNNTLSGVSCVSPTGCVAVGTASRESTIGNPGANRTLIEGWDGSRWLVSPSPNPGTFDDNQLAAVSCTSSHCAAVGFGNLVPPLTLSGVVAPRPVTVAWTAAENTRLRHIAVYLHAAPSAALKKAVYGTAYLIGLGSHARTPVTLPPIGSAASYTTVWNPSEFPVTDSVRAKYGVGSVGATRVSFYLLSYLLALGGH